MNSLDKFKEDLLQGEKSELIKAVSKQNKNLKHRFDEEVISKQNLQTNLKEIYKPITDTQLTTTGDQTTKTDALFRQLLADLQGKHDRSSRLLADIIRGLARTSEETRKQGLDIVSAIAKQPLLPELINELNNHPFLVKKIMQPGDVENLNDQDRKVLEPLSHLNDNDLKTLINYYVLQEKIKSSPDVSMDEEDLYAVAEVTPPTYTDAVFQEISTDSATYKSVITTLKKRKPGTTTTTSPIFYSDANDRDTVKFGNYNVLFKEDKIKIGDKEYILTPGLELLLNRIDPNIDERMSVTDLNNYLTISRDAGLDYRKHGTIGKKLENVLKKLNKTNELQKNYQVVGSGLNAVILPDNVEELKKRLTLLLGEYSAGNKSMFNEINAVLDILFKKRKISKTKVQKVLHAIKS